MRIIPSGSSKKIAIIAATRAELCKLQRLELLKNFNANISLEPQITDKFQCFMVVYAFDTGSQARLFRLAYSLAKRNGKLKNVRREYASTAYKENSYTRRKKEATKRRRLRRARKRARGRYFKLIPILKAGSIAKAEEKARQIAREQVIIDLL